MRICHALGALLLAVFGLAGVAHSAPSGSITVAPATGVFPYPAKVVWNVPALSTCTASGGWTGSKSASGSQDATISADTKFDLTCSTSSGSVTVSWTPPTRNTDGSVLSDLAGYNIFRGTSSTNLVGIAAVRNPGLATYIDENLAAGKYVYAMRSVNAAGDQSELSALSPSVTVSGSSWSLSTSATGTKPPPKPEPPLGVTTELVAYEVRPNSKGVMTASRVGMLPSGTRCMSEARVAAGVTYNRVDAASVDLINWPSSFKSVETWAQCRG